mgnify:CR=1 FL=1
MVSRGDDKYVIYPIYIDKSVSRKNGRKLSRKGAVNKPKIENIEKAAKDLDLNPILEENTSHPTRFWKKEGRIIVDKNDSKIKILRKIAKKLKS